MDWLDVLHVADSSFPTGAYVHSSGLESLGEDLEEVLTVRAQQTLGRFELVFLRHAIDGDLVALDRQFHAMVFAREARAASSAIGTSLLRAVADVRTDLRLAAFLRDGPYRHHPIAFGAVCAALDVPSTIAMSTYAFQSLRGLVSAAQRLGRLGQRDAQRVLQRVKPAVASAVEVAGGLELDEAGAFAPAWDIAAMTHERAPARMFAS